MGTNLPTYGRNETTITAREAEVPLADFDDGLNLGASNAPGIGINTGNPEPKLDDWTVLDQAQLARTPQNTQHIGSDGTTAGQEGTAGAAPVQAADYVAVDINDTLFFIEALSVATPGQGFGAANGAPINRTDVTIQIGERAWGTNPVA